MDREKFELIIQNLPWAEFSVKNPAVRVLHGKTVWMVDVDAAKRAFVRLKLPEKRWPVFWWGLEKRVEKANKSKSKAPGRKRGME